MLIHKLHSHAQRAPNTLLKRRPNEGPFRRKLALMEQQRLIYGCIKTGWGGGESGSWSQEACDEENDEANDWRQSAEGQRKAHPPLTSLRRKIRAVCDCILSFFV